jgi:hypothetical protein
MKRLTVSGTVLIKYRRIACKGEKCGVLAGQRVLKQTILKAQLNVVSHEMSKKSKSVSRFSLAQMIVILGSQASGHRLPLMIATQSPMIVYEDSGDH